MKITNLKEYVLGDISEFRYGKMPDKSIVSFDGVYPIFSGYKYNGYYPKYNCEENRLIIVARGVGGTGDVKITREKCWLTNLAIECVLDLTVVDVSFLYYYYLKDTLRYLDSGSAQSQITINDLKFTTIKLPPLNIQKSIASILSSLDDKIELNQKMNQTLEEMAQAIFKEWFIDFRFPGHEKTKFINGLPEGWVERTVGDYLETISETYPLKCVKKVIFLNTGDISNGCFLHNNYSDVTMLPGQAKKSIRKGDILFSEIRPKNKRFAYVNFDSSEYVVSTKLMVLRATTEIDSLFIYFILKQKESLDYLQMIAESRSGTFPQITFENVKTMKLFMPSDNRIILSYVKNILRNYYDKITSNILENENLSILRDSLLPKLLNGEIDVSEFEYKGML